MDELMREFALTDDRRKKHFGKIPVKKNEKHDLMREIFSNHWILQCLSHLCFNSTTFFQPCLFMSVLDPYFFPWARLRVAGGSKQFVQFRVFFTPPATSGAIMFASFARERHDATIG